MVGKVEADGRTHDWVSWGEVLAPNEGTTALAHYADQYYAGGTAAVTRTLGRGTVTYVGVDTQDGGLEAQLLRGVFQRAQVAVENFAPDFLVDWRDGFWVATNFTEKTQAAPVPAGVTLLTGTRDVPTAGVTVWQE